MGNAGMAAAASTASAPMSGPGLTPGLTGVPGVPVPEQPLQLSVLFPPIPAKLVAKIRSGAFVEMKDLLPDNLALQRQLQSMQSTKQASKAKLREVKSINTWMDCFLAYMAAATQDTRSRELLTYARLILRESLRTGGDGWATYDRLFREHAALDKSRRLDWTTLDPGLHQATFMRQASYGGKICSHCRETDHADHECALVSVKEQGSDRGPSPPPFKKGRPFRPKTSQRPETLENICISWNRGNCIFSPNCKMQHICASCKKAEHRAKDCPATADDAPYKQPFRQAGRTRAS